MDELTMADLLWSTPYVLQSPVNENMSLCSIEMAIKDGLIRRGDIILDKNGITRVHSRKKRGRIAKPKVDPLTMQKEVAVQVVMEMKIPARETNNNNEVGILTEKVKGKRGRPRKRPLIEIESPTLAVDDFLIIT